MSILRDKAVPVFYKLKERRLEWVCSETQVKISSLIHRSDDRLCTHLVNREKDFIF